MNDYMRELGTAAETWTGSFDQASAGIDIVDLVLQDPYDEEPSLILHLKELVSDDLGFVLLCDAAARTGSGPVTRGRHNPESGEVLRYAATRLELLTRGGELSSSEGVDKGWPGDTAGLLSEASRAAEALAELITYAVGRVTTNLSEGGLVALRQVDGAKGVPNQAAVAKEHQSSADGIAELLVSAANRLRALSGAIDQLQHTRTADALGTRHGDGPTLAREAVLEYRLPGMSNTARFHVRVFRPGTGKPVVVLGDMADNHSSSITNSVEEVAATVAELLLDGAAHDSVTWVQLYPDEKFSGYPAGLIQAVRFDEPFGRPAWRTLSAEELEEVAGGEVETWHAKDYTIQTMTQQGTEILRPATKRRRPAPPDTGRQQPPTRQPEPPARPKRTPWWRRRPRPH